ncbi:MAG: HD domain-containing protein [Candidatus Nealsonbacteria bacterium]
MIYKDRIYGEIKIEENVLLEIIKSPVFQRLEKVDSAGYPPLYYNPRYIPAAELRHERFEHSIGVYYLLKRYNASLEEQVAGLIHDVSHTVFSHCIDYVLNSGSEKEHSYQDNAFKDYVEKSDIPDILKKHNLDENYIFDEHNFPLLETLLPDLCADRIDYSLRTAVVFKEIKLKEADYFLNQLVIDNKHWVFKNYESAKKYAKLFFKLNKFYFSGLMSAVMFRTVGDVVKHALANNYISMEDLYTTDEEVLTKIKNNLNQDDKLQLLFDRMNNKVKFENNPENYQAHVFCKSRIVDPLFQNDKEIKKVSEVDEKWAMIIKEESQPKEYFIKFDK